MKRLAFISVIAFVIGLAPSASANHYIGYHWRATSGTTEERTETVVTSLQPRFNDPVAGAVVDWNKSPYINLVVTPGSTSKTVRQNCPFISGQIHVCSGSYGATGWVGLTQFRVSGHHILAVRIRWNSPYIPANFLRTVSCHELGHSIGLAHRYTTTSCMKQGRTSAHPDSHDYGELKIIYSHLDGLAPQTATTGTRVITVEDLLR